MKLISTTPNGQIFTCPCKKKVHLEYGNLLVNLSYDEFTEFVEYVKSINAEYYLAKNKKSQNRRKLLLYIGKKDAYLALNADEFSELKQLLLCKTHGNEFTDNQVIIGNTILN